MTNTTSNNKGGRGRPKEHRFEDYFVALNAFSRPGALVNARDLAVLIDATEERAATILQKLCGEHGDCEAPLLPLYSTQNENEYRRHDNINSGIKAKPLRLTQAQSQHCLSAFDCLGMPQDASLRRRVIDAYFPKNPGGTTTDSNDRDQLNTPTAQTDPNTNYEVLEICAQSLAGRRYKENANGTMQANAALVKFLYKGANDELTRSHQIVPLYVHLKSDGWNIEAYDRDSRSNKTFRAALIKDCQLLNERIDIPVGSQEKPDAGMLRLTCPDDMANTVLAWKGAHRYSENAHTKQTLEKEGFTIVEIPYYRGGGEWLVRHVLSLGNKVDYSNTKVAQEVTRQAKANLKAAKKLGIIK